MASADTVIRVEGVGKRYVIRHADDRGGYATLRDTLAHRVRSIASWAIGRTVSDRRQEEFWALKDIAFEIQRGEVVGIIGRNGAGKSTLLKILSQITEPTTGRIEIDGRVASLLEVGTGFHPELTGRENIFLNGAILGMSRAEIRRKFDEIVAFSEIEKFLDTPVKRYSSGMYTRLAFSVAAHLEPEILIIDEVLAVGDAEFQKKCLGKMGQVAKGGRTVLFVSHNMAAVQSLCSRGILLVGGKQAVVGSVEEAIASYLQTSRQLAGTEELGERKDREGGDEVRFKSIQFVDGRTGQWLNSLVAGAPVRIKMCLANATDRTLNNISVSVGFFSAGGHYLFGCRSDVVGKVFSLPTGETEAVCEIDKWPLAEGTYSYTLLTSCSGQNLDWVREAGFIEVSAGDYYGTGRLPAMGRPGVLVPYCWRNGTGD